MHETSKVCMMPKVHLVTMFQLGLISAVQH